jgi:dTDP-4-amino-4,6-dideoxygalactose transaminase
LPRLDFEARLRRYFDSPACYAVDSGRTAFHLILEVMKTSPEHRRRDQVILPAYTCPVLVNVVHNSGLTPVLCDIDPDHIDYDETQLHQSVNSNTLAVIHVHPFGLPRRVDTIARITESVNALLVEDACQAMGAEIENQIVGGSGVFGFASFGPGKPMNLGGGGVLVVNDPHWQAMVEKTVQGQNGNHYLHQPLLADSAIAWVKVAILGQLFKPAGWWVATRLGLHRIGDDERSWGYRLRWLSAAQSGIGQRSLAHLESLNTSRRHIGETLAEALADEPGIRLFATNPSGKSIVLRFPFLVEDLERRETLYNRLWSAGFGVGKVYRKTLAEIFPTLSGGSYPGAEYVARHLLTIPSHAFVRPADVTKMVEIIRKF